MTPGAMVPISYRRLQPDSVQEEISGSKQIFSWFLVVQHWKVSTLLPNQCFNKTIYTPQSFPLEHKFCEDFPKSFHQDSGTQPICCSRQTSTALLNWYWKVKRYFNKLFLLHLSFTSMLSGLARLPVKQRKECKESTFFSWFFFLDSVFDDFH